MSKFRVVVADPPWDYADTEAGQGCWQRQVSKAGSHYDQLSVGDICALPVPVADDAYCFLWIPSRHLLEGIGAKVLRAWGFRAITVQTWNKELMGLGYYIRNQTEHIAFGVRGKPGRFRETMRSLLTSRRERHSKKPEASFREIEQCCDGPYLELFARWTRPGWTSWGLEVGDPLGIGFDPTQWREPYRGPIHRMARGRQLERS